jgi:hypothetical protein
MNDLWWLYEYHLDVLVMNLCFWSGIQPLYQMEFPKNNRGAIVVVITL